MTDQNFLFVTQVFRMYEYNAILIFFSFGVAHQTKVIPCYSVIGNYGICLVLLTVKKLKTTILLPLIKIHTNILYKVDSPTSSCCL